MSDVERYFEPADAERAALRAAVGAVDQFITRLPSAHAGPERGLPEAWATLVKLLALGPGRELRTCPRCDHVAMRQATLCSHCWGRLAPMPQTRDDREVAGGGADT